MFCNKIHQTLFVVTALLVFIKMGMAHDSSSSTEPLPFSLNQKVLAYFQRAQQVYAAGGCDEEFVEELDKNKGDKRRRVFCNALKKALDDYASILNGTYSKLKPNIPESVAMNVVESINKNLNKAVDKYLGTRRRFPSIFGGAHGMLKTVREELNKETGSKEASKAIENRVQEVVKKARMYKYTNKFVDELKERKRVTAAALAEAAMQSGNEMDVVAVLKMHYENILIVRALTENKWN